MFLTEMIRGSVGTPIFKSEIISLALLWLEGKPISPVPLAGPDVRIRSMPVQRSDRTLPNTYDARLFSVGGILARVVSPLDETTLAVAHDSDSNASFSSTRPPKDARREDK